LGAVELDGIIDPVVPGAATHVDYVLGSRCLVRDHDVAVTPRCVRRLAVVDRAPHAASCRLYGHPPPVERIHIALDDPPAIRGHLASKSLPGRFWERTQGPPQMRREDGADEHAAEGEDERKPDHWLPCHGETTSCLPGRPRPPACLPNAPRISCERAGLR